MEKYSSQAPASAGSVDVVWALPLAIFNLLGRDREAKLQAWE